MTGSARSLIVTCGPKGHRLAEIGPDPQNGHLRITFGKRSPVQEIRLPLARHIRASEEADEMGILVHCRCKTGPISVLASVDAYAAGRRGRMAIGDILRIGRYEAHSDS